jgi:iron complex transport system permease protein
MHLQSGHIPEEYRRYIGRKTAFISTAGILLVVLIVVSIAVGAATLPLADVGRTLMGASLSPQMDAIIWRIRLPQALAAVIGGAALAMAGAVMQSVLRNPLGSPFTLGISHAAAFGAALSVMLLGTGTMSSTIVGAITLSNPYLTTASAFICCALTARVIVGISRIRGATPEIMVLAGVALSALFSAGIMFLQFFADDVQLAAMVFWTFGDAARASWPEIVILALITLAAAVFFFLKRWDYNAVDGGDETAKGLGVKVERVRMHGMLVASLVTAVTVAFLGVIGFVGLVCPHIVRRVIGGDHRFLLPATLLTGSVLLLASDTIARIVLAPNVLPVSVLTAFTGAPVFIYLILKGYRR